MERNVSMKQYRAFADCYFLSLRASAHTGVAIRIPNGGLNLSIFQRTDCHTSDIGHWFAMTFF